MKENIDKDFRNMWMSYKDSFGTTPEFAVFDYYLSLIASLNLLNPLSITPSLTIDGSIHITARFENLKIFIEAFFENGELNPIEVVFNVFKDTECIRAHSGTLKEVLDKVKTYPLNL